MAEDDFVVGEKVVLKSGGPAMTVSLIEGGAIHCQWFVGNKLNSGSFPPGTLVRVVPGKSRTFHIRTSKGV